MNKENIIFAPTRSGKGVGIVIPNCVNYPGSVLYIMPVVFDEKFDEKMRKQPDLENHDTEDMSE